MRNVKLKLSDKVDDLVKAEKAHGRSMNKTAKQIGIPASTLSKICSDSNKHPDTETLVKIAKYFNVSIDWLFGLSSAKSLEPRKKNAEAYFKMSPEAASNLKRYFEALPVSDEQKEMADWFISSVWFDTLMIAMSKYQIAKYNEEANRKPPATGLKIVVDDGEEKAETMERELAELRIMKTVSGIIRTIDEGAREAAQNGKH